MMTVRLKLGLKLGLRLGIRLGLRRCMRRRGGLADMRGGHYKHWGGLRLACWGDRSHDILTHFLTQMSEGSGTVEGSGQSCTLP